jgi:hypothetical protein
VTDQPDPVDDDRDAVRARMQQQRDARRRRRGIGEPADELTPIDAIRRARTIERNP